MMWPNIAQPGGSGHNPHSGDIGNALADCRPLGMVGGPRLTATRPGMQGQSRQPRIIQPQMSGG